MAGCDIIGSIAILNFNKEKKEEKLKLAGELLKRENINTILEKTERVKGRLRTIKTKFLAGKRTLETVHKENNCKFKLNVETCYFSPRLSEERKELAEKIKKGDKVLVMFSGVNPYGIIIAKKSRAKVTSIELGKECCRYAKENSRLNKVESQVTVIQGDVKKVIPKLKEKFNVIVMARPNLKESFLKEALSVARKGSRIYYYGFCKEDELDSMVKKIKEEAGKSRKKIKILKVKRAGDIAPYKYRYRVDIKVV